MIFNVYSIFDKVAREYLSPTLDVNHDTARRNFLSALLSAQTIMNKFPSDYELYYIGDFDSETSDISSITPVLVARGGELIADYNKNSV